MAKFVRRVHFVGIGGVGMSGIAEVLLNLGYKVQGSDLKESEITRRLSAAGARIGFGHRASHAEGAEVVVVSSAVKPDNPEVVFARRRGIPVIPRAEMLAELARLKRTVTVSGSHGKTTTTSMVSLALRAAGGDPTMIIGGQLKNIGGNARLGLGDYLVAEADESDGSFVRLSPLVAVVTNIDNDHLDHYKTMDNLKEAFRVHLERLPFYGAAVLCVDDPNVAELAKSYERSKVTYGIKNGDWQARSLELSEAGSRFELYWRGKRQASGRLRVSGRHNVLNAVAAVATGSVLGFNLKLLLAGLASFEGVGRRLERLGEAKGVRFVDDYGHHPTEIRATLSAVRLWKPRRLVAVFQPHRFSRTKLLHREFGPAFKNADLVYVTDIYPAGEKPVKGVTSRLVLDSIRKNGVDARAFAGPLDAARELKPGDVVLTVGAGDVWKIGSDLLRRLRDGVLSPA
ncbi:MAG: UDP-N-acetylmuramate--L-alanine ligase [Elusimicrobia bacterium]|nr:UDP-N-acetylmuramate--L-alanine ligase [Elusimicrobiota bacterium]